MVETYRLGAVLCVLCALLLGLTSETARAQYSFRKAALNHILETVQAESDFYFLYRKSLTSNIRLSLQSSEEEVLAVLQSKLGEHGLALEIDSTRKQVLVYRSRSLDDGSQSMVRVEISGHVVDAETDDRLPFATVIWEVDGSQSGVSANASGAFSLGANVPENASTLDLTCSYVGYASKTISLDVNDARRWEDLTFRLEPRQVSSREVVITGLPEMGDLDTTLSAYSNIGTFNPLGSSNTMRALQVLPSVSLTTAMSNGVHVRGSDSDGFRVLLDGVTIYNQSHLFGLLDSFNADVLKRNAFYYDVTPARYQASPGGTLSLLTRTGSVNHYSVTAGVNNTSARMTVEGPIKKGVSSFLLSSRVSHLNAADWFDNASLIEWGLNVDRPKKILEDGLVDVETQLVKPREADASFFDVHGKLNFESQSGNRLILSGYYGGDDTRQYADRLYRSFNANEGVTVDTREVISDNQWSNGSGSIRYQWQLSDRVYAHTTAGASIYKSNFRKDDFTYTSISPRDSSLRTFTYPFENESILNELNVDQQFDATFGETQVSGGLSYYYYLGEYLEDSFDRSGYFISREAHRFDLYGEMDYSYRNLMEVQAGARTHYYQQGDHFYLSPRFKIRLFPESVATMGGGYSRNFQFLHQISLNNTVTADVWVVNAPGQSPTYSDYYSAHLSLKPWPLLFFQAEGYWKQMENVRLYELNTYTLGNSFSGLPWFTNNDGTSKGLEFLLRNHFGFASLTQTFTLSRTRLSNPQINDGESFFVNWDRTYQYSAMLKTNPFPSLSIFLSWMYASGAANQRAIFGSDPQERLGDYRRADASIRYRHKFETGTLRATFSIYNMLDRKNPWYRDMAYVIDRKNDQTEFRKVPVDVFGLGFRPSLDISFSF